MTAINPKDLPDKISIFPLSSALLLPGGRLPLHIFEERYINLMNDALNNDGLFGMVQPRALTHKYLTKSNLLYPVGCLGKIIEVQQREGDTLDILVLGISRYRIISEIENHTLYRQVDVDYEPFMDDLKIVKELPIGRRKKLLDIVEPYMLKQGLSLNQEAMTKLKDDELITALSMLCPFEPAEKQALLENLDILARAETLKTLMEFSLADNTNISKSAQH